MAVYQGDVTSYDLVIKTTNQPNYYSVIHIIGSFGTAFLTFVPEGGRLPANRKRPGLDSFDVSFWMSSWMQVLDLLRNEKPVQFFYDDSNNTAFLQTGQEPVGEEEGR